MIRSKTKARSWEICSSNSYLRTKTLVLEAEGSAKNNTEISSVKEVEQRYQRTDSLQLTTQWRMNCHISLDSQI
jgi:hypothetical protein